MPDPAVVRSEAEALCTFLDAAPTPFHAVAVIAQRLRDAGWVELDERAAWVGDAGGRFVVHDAADFGAPFPAHRDDIAPLAHADRCVLHLKS